MAGEPMGSDIGPFELNTVYSVNRFTVEAEEGN